MVKIHPVTKTLEAIHYLIERLHRKCHLYIIGFQMITSSKECSTKETQNANECLNSVIWSRCPKTVFMGKSRIDGAASMAIATFNEGATAITNVMNKLWLDSTLVPLEQSERSCES